MPLQTHLFYSLFFSIHKYYLVDVTSVKHGKFDIF